MASKKRVVYGHDYSFRLAGCLADGSRRDRMVLHSLLLRSCPPHLGKERSDHDHRSYPLLGREGMVAMVVHSFLLRNDPPLLGKERSDRGHRSPPSSGEGKGWWACSYTAFCLEALILYWEREGVIMAIGPLPLSGAGKGWGSRSLAIGLPLFWGRERVVVMVIHSLLLRSLPPHLGKGRGDDILRGQMCITITTSPTLPRRG